MTNAQAFDQAFRPTDQQVDRLAQLMGSITQLFPGAGMAAMNDNGKRGLVTNWYCAICADANGGRGYPNCDHKDALRLALQLHEHEANDEGGDVDTYRAALGVGVQ